MLRQFVQPGGRGGELAIDSYLGPLAAELDMIVGLTACSSEVTNAGSLKPIDFEILADSTATIFYDDCAFDVPITSSQVTSRESRNAIRLKPPLCVTPSTMCTVVV